MLLLLSRVELVGFSSLLEEGEDDGRTAPGLFLVTSDVAFACLSVILMILLTLLTGNDVSPRVFAFSS